MNLADPTEKAPETVPQPEQGGPQPEGKEAGLESAAEKAPTPEKAPDKAPGQEKEPASAPTAATAALPSQPTVEAKDGFHQQIERVMEDDLVDMYLKMDKGKRLQFKQEGERVASRLRQMIEASKVKAKEVLKLIRNWLKMIPGINRYFLEQSAKIKTDRVLRIAEERRTEKETEI